MFNLEWLKNLIKTDPEPSLDERIAARVGILQRDAHCAERAIQTRLEWLETRHRDVDAFYVKTVTQALSERQAKIAEDFNFAMNSMMSNTNGKFQDLIDRIDSLTKDLKAEAERNGRTNLRLDALVSKLRAGLE